MTISPTDQKWSAKSYVENAGFVSDLSEDVVRLLAPQPGEKILDLGCGDGRLTEQLIDVGCDVVAIDASADMVASCKDKHIDAYVADGQNFELNQKFDATFSNAALHWMPDYDGVIKSVSNHLNQGGRFVAEFGGFANIAAIVTALSAAANKFDGDAALACPWFFPTEEFYALALEKHGFEVVTMERVSRITPLPTGIKGWLSVFRPSFFEQFDQEIQQDVLDYVVQLLEPSLQDEQGNWWADYARLRFYAKKS